MCMSGSFVFLDCCVHLWICCLCVCVCVCGGGGGYYTVFTQYVSSTEVSSVAL